MTSLPTESNMYSWDQWELWRQYNQQYYPPYWQFYQPYIPNPVTTQSWRYPEQETDTQPLDLRVDELFMNENTNRDGIDTHREDYVSKIPCNSPNRIQENPSSEDDATFEEEIHSEVRYTSEKHPLLDTMLKTSDDDTEEVYQPPVALQPQETEEPVNSPYTPPDWNETEKSPPQSPLPENMTKPTEVKTELEDSSPKSHSPPLTLPPFSTISSFSEENHRLSEPKSQVATNLLPPNGVESVSSSSSVYSSSYTNSPYASEQLINSPDRTIKEEKPDIAIPVTNSISEESWRNSYTATPDRLPYVSNDVVSSSFHATQSPPNLSYYSAASQHNVNFLSYRNGPSHAEMAHSSMPTSSLRVDAGQEYKYNSLGADSPLYKNDEAKATNRRQRVLYSDYQNAELEKQFQINRYIRGKDRQQLAMLLNLTEEQIKLWFQNKRNRAKKYYQRRLETTTSHLRPQDTPPRNYLTGQASGISSSVSPTPNPEIHQMMSSCPPQYQHISSHFNFYNSSQPKNVDM